MKGLSLPINVLVIVVIAVIVLLGIVALYFGGFNPFSAAIGVEGVKNEKCGELVRKGCSLSTASLKVDNFDADQDGKVGTAETGSGWTWTTTTTQCGVKTNTVGDNLASICDCYYNRITEPDCKRLCGCP